MRSKRQTSIGSVLIAVGVSAIVGGAVTFAALNHNRGAKLEVLAKDENQRAEEAIAAARREANQANRAREQAEELVEFVLDDLRTGLLPIGRTELLSAAGERAAAYFEGLPPDQITPETELNRGKVLITIGQALTDQGDYSNATKRFRAGLAVFDNLVAREPDNTTSQFELAWSLTEFSIILNKRQEFDEANAANLRAVELFQSLIVRDSQHPDWVYGLAAAHLGLGTTAAGQGESTIAIEEYDRCVTTARRALAIDPGHILSMQALAIALNNTGLVHVRNDDFAKAIPIHQQGCEAMRELMTRDPKTRRWEKELATGLNNIGISHDALGNYAEADRFLNEALVVRQGLAAWDSRNSAWLLNLANSWHNIAALKFDLKQDAAAHAATREAMEVYHRLVMLEPGNDAWLDDMNDSHTALVRELQRSNRVEAILNLYEALIGRARELLADTPSLLPWEDCLAWLYRDLARAHVASGLSSEERLSIWKNAAAVRAQSCTDNPDSKGARHRLGVALARLGLAAREAGASSLELQSFVLARYLVSTVNDGTASGGGGGPSRSARSAARDHSIALAGNALNVIVTAGNQWRYYDKASVPPDWATIEFDDSEWPTGKAPLGYGDGDEATVVEFGDDPRDKNITVWFRRSIDLTAVPGNRELYLGIVCDDGAVAFWNGREIARYGMPVGAVTRSTVASRTAREPEEHDFNEITLNASDVEWRSGKNIIAVRVHQNEAVSSDLRFDLELIAGLRRAEPLEGLDATVAIRELGNLIPQFLLEEIDEATNQPAS